MDKVNYYNKIFKEGKDREWDKAPGKTVILNAIKDYNLYENAVILDIGCATGYMLSLIFNTLSKNYKLMLIGIDISEVALNIAKQRYPNIKFIIGDGINLSFKDSCIDLSINYGTLEHFDNPEKGIKEIARVLRQSGLFLHMIPALGHYRKDRADEGWYGDKTGQPQWNFFRKTWERFFEKSGLQLNPMNNAIKYGAENPGCFFFGKKIW